MICKSCGSEVSPYITECPYCGNRLRKRAPKLDRDGRVAERKRRRRRHPCRGCVAARSPGSAAETRPYATIALVLAGLVGTLLWRTALVGSTHAIELWARFGTHCGGGCSPPRSPTTTPATRSSRCRTIAVYGWLLERRHGPGAGARAVPDRRRRRGRGHAADSTLPLALGANGAALALLIAWAIPDLLALRAGEDIDGDLLGTAVIAVVVVLMPLAAPGASWMAAGVGVLAGILVGLPLALRRALVP